MGAASPNGISLGKNIMSLRLTLDNLQDHIGADVGVSPWVEITQDRINAFADITVDHQFIHLDPEQAVRTPFGGTIAHGFLILSLLTHFAESGAGTSIEGVVIRINYGFDRLRFLSPVRAGHRVRGRAKLLSVTETKPNQFRIKQEVTVDIEGEEKPALVAEWLTMAVVG